MSMRLNETETCGSSRELIRKFLKMSAQERGAMTDEEKTQMALAFHHIQNCVHRDIPNSCIQFLEEKLRPLTNEKNKQYDPQVARYLMFGEFPLHNAPLTEDNPLRKLKW